MSTIKYTVVLPAVLLQLTFAPVLVPIYGAAHRTSEEGSDGGCPFCPYFINTTTQVTAPQGLPANLTCGVRNLADRKVSWIRREDLHVLTTGTFTYTTDVRFRVLHLEGSPYWTLEVGSPTVNDSGVYECQVSTQPKIFRRFTLNVIVPRAEITGTQQLFMKAGSDINITCVIAGAVRGAPVTWYHVLPQPRHGVKVVEINIGERGGVQLVTNKNEGTSWLLVSHATWKDAGNYTCAPAYAKPASVSVHVLDEETPAAMQHDLQPSSGSRHHGGLTPLSFFLLLSWSFLNVVFFAMDSNKKTYHNDNDSNNNTNRNVLELSIDVKILLTWSIVFVVYNNNTCWPTGGQSMTSFSVLFTNVYYHYYYYVFGSCSPPQLL